MLYLEDFLEVIEHVPTQLKDKLYEMRHLDLEVQNAKDQLQTREDRFFANAPNMTTEQKEAEVRCIKNEYRLIEQKADAKVRISECLHEMMKRHQSKLGDEITKFKLELEAESPGITDTLERKVRERDQASRTNRKERRRKQRATEQNGGTTNMMSNTATALHPTLNTLQQHSQPTVNVGRVQSQPHGLHDQSYVHNQHAGASTSVSVMGPPPTPGSSHANYLPSFTPGQESLHGRPRKFTSRVQEMVKASMAAKRENDRMLAAARVWTATATGSKPPKRKRVKVDRAVFTAGGSDSEQEEDDDESERKWCICQQPSYGEMVACDSGECAFEWFHYDCVNVTQPPKGKWICPHCQDSMKRRNKHANEMHVDQ